MDSFFYKNYYEYFLWNNGLIEHFFKKGKSEILLHIDKQLLEEIGKSKGIEADDYQNEFISSVENFCAHYNRYICTTNDPNGNNVCGHFDCKYYSSIFCLKSNRRLDVLAVANHIYSKDIKYFDKYEDNEGCIRIRVSEGKKPSVHSMPFFAIIIYVILKFDNGKTQEWNNVGENISPKSRTFIPELWEKINLFDNRFDKDASVYDHSNSEYGDYAGRILYHLPLSASTRNKIQDAIYKSSIWKLVDSKSFVDIIGLIINSLKDIKANEELKNILLSCYSSNDYKGISARKIQSVIDDFDIDVYESNLAQRKETKDYKETIVNGEFALGVYIPDDEEQTNSIVLLTTVQQYVNEGGFCINEGKSGTLAGYNTSFVKLQNQSEEIELKDYALKKNCYHITPLPTENVIFFYEYDDSLFIQTRTIKPAKSYIIAVRNGSESVFNQWCIDNRNTLVQWPNEDTRDLFGENWTIFYTENKLNGQYYQNVATNSERQESSTIIMKGGIKKSNGCYFINALPYFEIPTIYNPEDIKVFMNLNGGDREDIFTYKVIDNRIILNIKEMPIGSSEIAYMDIRLEHNGNTNYCYSIDVCGQSIIYDPSYAYRFDQFGTKTENDHTYYGNHVDIKYQSANVRGLFQINKEDFNSISDDLYFTNLLAACCYDSKYSEIAHAKFRKCISYAATRLNINIQQKEFISNTKRILSKAGLLHIDYSTGKCQAIVPSFMRVPFSLYQTQGSQLLMLGGCYTRAFVADLIKYCDGHQVNMFCIKNKSQKDEEKLLPPIILLGPNFSPSEFSKESGQQCDVLDNHDFALSLLNIIPSYSYNDIYSKFQFNVGSSNFISQLEPATTVAIPRIRSMRSTGTHKTWYIEKANNKFAKIEQGMLPWASIICHHEMNAPMVIKQKDYSVYLPATLLLPNYVDRALYLMNLGLPETQKVFVCGTPGNTYYTLMNQYKLHDQDRCNILASKMSNNHSNLVRDAVQTTHRMELYKSQFNGRRCLETYMILKNRKGADDILAVAHKHKIYLNCQGKFYRLDTRTVNEAMSFLIQNKNRWKFEPKGASIGYTKNGGLTFESVFTLTDEVIKLPDLSQFHKEDIQII
ncbi:hypothetical protein Q3C19_00670 [Bacteroides sp. ET489]|uniref:hypothetical protein n=1 Tax=Bacteroides sp. ET489 TaxID=3057126 RepID=UPI0026734341|nr:hypothetical protein [Bacteroides sp. ET489]MDO3388979.1 hypothetical protein [Bacteroides sp. ET489]